MMENMYDKELLWSGSDTSAFNSTKPFSSFEKIELHLNTNNIVEINPYASTTLGQFPVKSMWSADSYLAWNYRFTINNNSKHFNINRYQMIYQSTTKAPKLFGFTNSAGNIKRITACYGINAINPTGSFNGAGSPGEGWKEYNETVLYSGSLTSTINLSEPATSFERLKIVVGVPSESVNYYEYNAPTTSTQRLTTQSLWGSSTASYYYGYSWWEWYNNYKSLSSTRGKMFQLGTAGNTAYSAAGNIGDDNFVRRPIRAIIGINHK